MWGHQVPCEKSREEWVLLSEGCMGEPVSFTSSGLCFQDKYVWYLTGLPASPLLDLNTKSFKDLTALYLLVGFSKNDTYPAVTYWWDDFGVSSWYLLIFLQVFYYQVLFNPFRMYFKNKIKMQYFAGCLQPSILHYAQVRILQSTGVLQFLLLLLSTCCILYSHIPQARVEGLLNFPRPFSLHSFLTLTTSIKN